MKSGLISYCHHVEFILIKLHNKVISKARHSQNIYLILLFLIIGHYNCKQELSNLNKGHAAHQKIRWQLTFRYNLPTPDTSLCFHVEFWVYCVLDPLCHSDVASPNESGSTMILAWFVAWRHQTITLNSANWSLLVCFRIWTKAISHGIRKILTNKINLKITYSKSAT